MKHMALTLKHMMRNSGDRR